MKHERFDVFEYIVDEIWNIATNPQRSYGFPPYIQCMIEVVANEKFHRDVAHELLHPTTPKDPRIHHTTSPSSVVAPSHTTCSGGASSTSSSNSRFLKMFQGIFAMCRCTDQHMDVMEQRLQIVQCNQEIIHNQWDDPLLKVPDVPVYPPVSNPYASLTPAELAAFGIGPAHAPDDDYNNDEEAANDDEEPEEDEYFVWWLHFFESFPFLVS
jgi:hypothetical protein